jgi:Dolichyl-phosphate-mannose-protein mannosyltransferase
MNGLLIFAAFILGIAIILFAPVLATPYVSPFGPAPEVTIGVCVRAVLFCVVVAFIAGVVIRRDQSHGLYLFRLFLVAVLLRVAVGTAIFVFNGQDFFGGDAWTYDFYGLQQTAAWSGDRMAAREVNLFVGSGFGSGWGMVYLVGAIYEIIGRNMLAIQFLNAVLGAATAPIIFLCAKEVFNNSRVARIAGLAVAFYPSLVLWSSQGLKDAAIVFSLALSILAALKLGKKFSVTYLVTLALALFCVLAFRFYVFYMIMVAIVGALAIGMRSINAQSFARQFVVVIMLGLAFTYLGITRYANVQFEQFGNLQRVQRSRLDAASSAESGFGRDVDVSTTSGALMSIPVGVLYLLFAPFPWQLGSLRQMLTLPEMIVWWASFPLLVLGIWFSIKYRLRQMSPILIFTSMLTLAYSVFQGNVGTAYRQRAQLLVFYFIFVAVGGVLLKEKREEKRRRAAEELRDARRFQPAMITTSPEQHA